MTDREQVEIRHLRALLALVQEETFTDAAIALGTTQATVTRTIQQLERAVGRRLLDRSNRGATPTQAGREFAERAAALLAQWDRLLELPAPQRLTVGCPWAGFGGRTGAIYRAWEARDPGAGLAVLHIDSPTGGVVERRADVGVLRAGVPDGLAHAVVGHERRACAVARHHPLGRRRVVTLDDVAAHTVALNRRTGTTHESLFARPVATAEVFDTDHWLDTIERGTCVGITSEATAAHYARPGVRYVPIRDAPDIEVALAWRRDDPHPLTELLVDVVRAVYAESDSRATVDTTTDSPGS